MKERRRKTGGGSLAAGGLGVAGGIIAGPALLAPGTVMRATASANLENAYANLAEVKRLKGRLM